MRLSSIGLLLAAAACGSDASPRPAGDAGVDAEAPPDASAADAGDGGDGRDAGAGSEPDYAFVFDPTVVRTVHLIFTAADWDALQEDWGQDVPVTVEVEGEVYPDVAVHYKGNVSLDYAGEKKSFKLDFDDFVDGQRFHGLERLNLHNGFKDPTLMRETLSYELHAAAGDLASRTSYARVALTVPGLYDEEYFGLYVNVEAVDRRYVRDRLGDDTGTLYEGGDFRWYGPDWQEYVPDPYEPKTNQGSTDHAALLRFLEVLDGTPTDQLGAALEEVFDVERFLGWLAANTLLSNMDGVPGGGGNCFVYHDVGQDRMVLIPWDMNEAFGSTSEGLSVDELLELDVHAPVVFPGAQPLIERVLEVPELADRYDDKLRALVDGAFREDTVSARIDALKGLIRADVAADTRRHYTLEQFDASLDEDVPGLPNPPYPEGNVVIGLRRFVRERDASVRAQLGL